MRDLLIRTARGDTLPVKCTVKDPEVCGAKLVHPKSLVSLHGDPHRKNVNTRVVAHSAISNSLLRVRQEQFFNQEVVEAGTEFEGELWAEGDEACRALQEMPQQSTLVIGRGGTRGMGLVDLTLKPKGLADLGTEIRNRLSKSADNLRVRFAHPDTVVFTATFHSPCVLLDEWLCTKTSLSATDIDPELSDYGLQASYSRMMTISGWNAQAGLPKPDISALAPGSCFLFGRQLSSNLANQEMDRIAAILARHGGGIGEYWEEGFGEVEFCWPFHYVRQLFGK